MWKLFSLSIVLDLKRKEMNSSQHKESFRHHFHQIAALLIIKSYLHGPLQMQQLEEKALTKKNRAHTFVELSLTQHINTYECVLKQAQEMINFLYKHSVILSRIYHESSCNCFRLAYSRVIMGSQLISCICVCSI